MVALVFTRENDALDVNPPAGSQQLSVNGSDWLWAVTAIYFVTFFVFLGLSFAARAGEKIFHYLFATAVLVGLITYYAEASDLAYTVVNQANQIQNGTRQIFWAKYVNWVVAFPAVITSLGLLSGISWATIFYQIALAWIWIISYLVAAFTGTSYKWGFFAFGTLAWLVLAVSTLTDGRKAARRIGAVTADHLVLSSFVNFLWLLYPLAWGLSDGGNYIGVTGHFIWFGILDLALVPVTGFILLFLSRRWDYGRLNIAFTQYGRVHAPAGTFPEKHAATPAAAAGAPAAAAPADGVAAEHV